MATLTLSGVAGAEQRDVGQWDNKSQWAAPSPRPDGPWATVGRMMGKWGTAGGRLRRGTGQERRTLRRSSLYSLISRFQLAAVIRKPTLPARLPTAADVAVTASAEIVLGDLPPFLPLPSPRDTQLLMMQQRPPLIFSGALATIFFPLIVISIC